MPSTWPRSRAATTASRCATRAGEVQPRRRLADLLRRRRRQDQRRRRSRSAPTRSPTPAASRSASSRRSCRGIRRSLLASGSSARRWPPATPWCSSRPSRRRSASLEIGRLVEEAGLPARRRQRRARLWRGGRRRARRASGRRQDLLHRRPPHRAADHGAPPRANLKRCTFECGGKSPLHRLRRRRPRQGADRRDPQRLPLDRPVLLARLAPLRRAPALRPLRRRRWSSASRRIRVGMPLDPSDPYRPADLGRAARQDRRATSSIGREEGARAPDRRRPARGPRPRLLRRADDLRQRRQPLPPRAGGDLRPGAGAHAVRQ